MTAQVIRVTQEICAVLDPSLDTLSPSEITLEDIASTAARHDIPPSRILAGAEKIASTQ